MPGGRLGVGDVCVGVVVVVDGGGVVVVVVGVGVAVCVAVVVVVTVGEFVLVDGAGVDVGWDVVAIGVAILGGVGG